MRIYLDNCSLQRALDDRSQLRIALEAEITLSVLAMSRKGELTLVSSDVLRYETLRNSNVFRKEYCLEVLEECESHVELNEYIEAEAAKYVASGVKPMDALHLASAESIKVDYFCTCDDAFLKKAKRLVTKTKAVSLMELMEELEK